MDSLFQKATKLLWYLIILVAGASSMYFSAFGLNYFFKAPSYNTMHTIISPKYFSNNLTLSKIEPLYLEQHVSSIEIKINASSLSIPRKNPKTSILCQLGINQHCNSYQVADVIDTFWIIAPLYAPYQNRVQIRYQSHKYFQNNIETIGMPFCTLDAIRKDRQQTYLMTKPGREPYDIQLEFYDDGYLRENLLNVAARKIKGWQYIGWIDAHHLFENPFWWEEAIVRMEKYPSVQLFQRFNGFTKTNHSQIDWLSALYKSFIQFDMDNGLLGFYGNAYGISKEYYDQMGYVFDRCIAGCCDCAYVKASLQPEHNFEYFRQWWRYTNQMNPWIENTTAVFRGKRAIVRGVVYHIPHEETFPYLTILGIANSSDFDIERDLIRDENFTLRLTNEAVKRRIEFWVFLYSYAVPLYVIGISSGSIVFIICVYLIKRSRDKKRRRQNERFEDKGDTSLE